MKNFKKTIIALSFIFTFSLSQSAFSESAFDMEAKIAAAQTSEAVSDSNINSGAKSTEDKKVRTVQQIMRSTDAEKDLKSVIQSEAMVLTVYGAKDLNAISVSIAEDQKLIEYLRDFPIMFDSNGYSLVNTSNAFINDAQRVFQKTCQRLSMRAVECCGNSDTCSKKGKRIAKLKNSEVLTGLSIITGLVGGDRTSGLLQCLKALPNVVGLAGQAKGIKVACNTLRTGGTIMSSAKTKSSKNSDSFVVIKGIQSTCSDLHQVINSKRIDSSLTGAKNNLLQAISQISRQADKALAAEESKVEKAMLEALNSVEDIKGCATALAGTDDVNSLGNIKRDPFCSGSAKYSKSRGTCVDDKGQSIANNHDNGVFSKAGTPTGNLGDVEVDIPDDEVIAQNESNGSGSGGSGSSNKTGVGSNTNAGGGFGSGLSGFGSGSSNKAGGRGRRGYGKAKSLIAGYKTSRGGRSGSSSGYRKPSSFKGFGGFGKKGLGRNGKKVDPVALAALSKLVKAGVSPDQSGSIFKRVENRFRTNTVTYNLFDAKKNKQTGIGR